jgi:hypothetical protein
MVQRLAAAELITAPEEKHLNAIVDAVYDNSSVAAALKTVADLSRRIQRSAQASPVAMAVGGVGLNSITTLNKEKSGNRGTSAADLGGALTGANLGSKGGIWGRDSRRSHRSRRRELPREPGCEEGKVARPAAALAHVSTCIYAKGARYGWFEHTGSGLERPEAASRGTRPN